MFFLYILLVVLNAKITIKIVPTVINIVKIIVDVIKVKRLLSRIIGESIVIAAPKYSKCLAHILFTSYQVFSLFEEVLFHTNYLF